MVSYSPLKMNKKKAFGPHGSNAGKKKKGVQITLRKLQFEFEGAKGNLVAFDHKFEVLGAAFHADGPA